MSRGALVALLLAGCVFDPGRQTRPSRLMLGATGRHLASPINSSAAFRDTTPPPRALMESHHAVAATAQFTQGMRHHTYIGGELEAGMLDHAGSNLAGAYGVFGIDHPLSVGSIGAELASGWRSVSYSIDTEDVSKIIVEPRVRAQVWLSEFVTLAVTGGMTIGEQSVWMTGISIGIHSHVYGTKTPFWWR